MVYDAIIKCPNCGHTYTFKVKGGVLVRDHLRLKSETCSNCNMRIDSKL